MPEADPPLAENRPSRLRFPPTHCFGRAGKARQAEKGLVFAFLPGGANLSQNQFGYFQTGTASW
ncbi:hypothetical protein B9J78_03375 [bacterium Unc6]|nr:hypothetical protein [bacterium Unc6]